MNYEIGDVIFTKIDGALVKGIIEDERVHKVTVRILQSDLKEMYNKTHNIDKYDIIRKVEFEELREEGHIRNLIDIALTEKDETEFNRLSVLLLGCQARDRLKHKYGLVS